MSDMQSMPATAGVKVFPSWPALSAEAAESLRAAAEKLFIQFQREGNVVEFALAVEGDGHFFVVSWTGAGEGLSGCRKDKLAKVIALHEERSGVSILDAKPLWVRNAEGAIQGCTPIEFKEGVAAGWLQSSTASWNTMAETLADWQAHADQPLENLAWLKLKFERVQARLK